MCQALSTTFGKRSESSGHRACLIQQRWENDNLTTLCNDNCTAQIDDWNFNVAYTCYDQTLSVGGKLVPADTVPGRYLDGINLACLMSSGYDEEYDGYPWCLTQSFNWTGSDVVRPDCTATPSDPQCQDPTDIDPGNQRLANLYTDDVLCSSWYVRCHFSRRSVLFDLFPAFSSSFRLASAHHICPTRTIQIS